MVEVDRPTDDYFLGLDLGQAVDYSCLATLRRRIVLGTDAAWRQIRHGHYTLRGCKRWDLGTLYTSVVKDVVGIVSKPPLAGSLLAVDATGCGKPVVEMLTDSHPSATVRPVLITAGHEVSLVGGDYRIPKRELVAVLQLLLQSRRLDITESIKGHETILGELKAFRCKITARNHDTYEADWRERAHDDQILAIAIAAWFAERETLDVGEPIILSQRGVAPDMMRTAGGPFMRRPVG